MFSRAFRNILTKPVQLTEETLLSLNNYGDNLQGKCSWYIMQPSWSPAGIDAQIQCQENLGAGDVKRTVDICLSKFQTWCQFKNMGNQRADVTLYKLYPKRDLLLGGAYRVLPIAGTKPGIYTGAANEILPAGATAATQASYPGAPGGWRLPVWNEHNYNIFDNVFLPDMFTIKKTMRKFIEPGQFVVLKNTDFRERVLGYGDFGIATTELLQTRYEHLKMFGPLWLFRIQGSAMHNKTIAAPITDATTGATMGCYNVEMYIRKRTESYGAVGTAPQKQISMLSARLPTMLLANEAGFEMRQAQNAAMDVDP